MTRFKGWGNNKYGNQITEYNGHKYHSKKEAAYAQDLDWKLKSGVVLRWERQVKMQINIAEIKITSYICDFVVTYHDRVEYVDVKGYKKGAAYEMFKIKKNLVLAVLGIEIIEK